MSDPVIYVTYDDEPIEVRSEFERIVEGIVVPYNRVSKGLVGVAPRRRERFAPGSVSRSFQERGRKITFHGGHPYPVGNPDADVIGGLVEYRDSAAGMRGSFKVVDSPIGDHWLALARDGVASGFSVGFVEMRGRYRDEPQEGGVLLRTQLEAGVRHVALTTNPSYDESLVLAVRSATDTQDEPPPPAGRSLAEVRRRMTILGVSPGS